MLLPPSSQPAGFEVNFDFFLNHAAAYDLLESAVAMCDARGEIRYANQAFQNFNQSVRDQHDNFGKYATLLECPQCHDWLQSAVFSGASSTFKRTFCYAARLITVDLNILARPLLSYNGATQGCLLTIAEESIRFGQRHLAQIQEANRNLTERIKVLSREKMASERLVRLLLKESPFAIVLMDDKQKVIQANLAAEKLFEIPASEMTGLSCERFLPCYAECACCPAIELGRRIEGVEIPGMTARLRTLPLLRSVSLVNTDNGIILVEAFVDLSDIKAAERMINELAF